MRAATTERSSRRSFVEAKVRTCVERSSRYRIGVRTIFHRKNPRGIHGTTESYALDASGAKYRGRTMPVPGAVKRKDLRRRAHQRNATVVMASHRLPRRPPELGTSAFRNLSRARRRREDRRRRSGASQWRAATVERRRSRTSQ